MFKKLKMRIARRREAHRIARIFRDIDKDVDPREIEKLIEAGKVIIFRDKKKIRGAFTYGVLGIVGILSLLYVHRMAVDQKMRGRGFGSFVLGEIKALTQRKKAQGFFLWSRKQAQGFYTKNKLQNFWRCFFWWKK